MVSQIHRSFPLPAILWLFITHGSTILSQSVSDLHDFSRTDGEQPIAGLCSQGTTLYGITAFGGIDSTNGTVFAMNIDGSGFTNLYSFSGIDALGNNPDGALPTAGLVLSSNTVFGAAQNGGPFGSGTVFAIKTDGSGFRILHNFSAVTNSLGPNEDGANPTALVLSGETIFGTAQFGGASGIGSIFSVRSDGSGFTNLHSFNDIDGLVPQALILFGDTLYGTTVGQGISDRGTVFSVKTNGSDFSTLHRFDKGIGGPFPYGNNDGGSPASLVLVSNTLYGAASYGGRWTNGTLWAMQADGSSFRTLHTFSQTSGKGTNEDGASPYGQLVVVSNILYGTASKGGTSYGGVIFSFGMDGSGFTNIHSLLRKDGFSPQAGLLLLAGNLYGTAVIGGRNGYGTVFSVSLSPAPQLSIAQVDNTIIISWPNRLTTVFTLQATASLEVPAWTNFVVEPTNVNGVNTVTTTIMGGQLFYRLSQ